MAERVFRAAVIDDEKDIVTNLSRILEKEGFETAAFLSGEGFLRKAGADSLDILFIDVNLGQGVKSGIDVLKELKEAGCEARMVIISGNADVGTAVEALKLGAHDFLEKPFGWEAVRRVLKPFRQEVEVRAERDSLLAGVLSRYELIGSSAVMERVRRELRNLADLKEPVLITGESGTGKELAAGSLHFGSFRRGREFFRANMAALSGGLIESQLFGYRKGAFSGAHEDRPGLFREAAGSSLFLDEIGELDLGLQAKLLRVLQEKEVLPLGASSVVPVDTRIILATNRHLEREVEAGRFREDLFYRINAFEVRLPPLREHREDIPELARVILDQFSDENNLVRKTVTPAAADHLINRDYPGNVRQLKNIVIKAAVRAGGSPRLDISHMQEERAAGGETAAAGDIFWESRPLSEKKRELEGVYLRRQLAKHGGDCHAAAESLGILVNNLYRKLREHRIDRRSLTGGDENG